MSWAAHDPEGWTEVCINAVQAHLDKHRTAVKPDPAEERAVLEHLADTYAAKDVWHALVMAASHELGDAEADYLSARYGR